MEFPVVKLRTLTPLWLGDADRNSSAAKESGLIGSLRFWCEGIARSFGKRVCQGDRCSVEDKRGLCTVCELFGTTSWARRFRLEIEGLEPIPIFFRASQQVVQATGNWLWNIFGGEKTGGTRKKNASGTAYTVRVSGLWNPSAFSIRILPRVGATDAQ